MANLILFDLMCNSIENIKKKYKQNIFVETGCYNGDSINTMKVYGYDRIYSCDINPNMINTCRKRFNVVDNDPDTTLMIANSLDFLKIIIPSLPKEESIFFFLDAHLPNLYDDTDGSPLTGEYKLGDNVKNQKFDLNFPLETELDVIYEHRKDSNDYIVCDDARVYMESNWGCGNWEGRDIFGEQLNFNFINKYTNWEPSIYTEEEGFLILTKRI